MSEQSLKLQLHVAHYSSVNNYTVTERTISTSKEAGLVPLLTGLVRCQNVTHGDQDFFHAHLDAVSVHIFDGRQPDLYHMAVTALLSVKKDSPTHSNYLFSVGEGVRTVIPEIFEHCTSVDGTLYLDPMHAEALLENMAEQGFSVNLTNPNQDHDPAATILQLSSSATTVREYELLFIESNGSGQANNTLILVGKSMATLGHVLGIDLDWYSNEHDRLTKPDFNEAPNGFGELGYAFWTGIPDEEVTDLILSILVVCSSEKYFGQVLHPHPFTWSDFHFLQTEKLLSGTPDTPSSLKAFEKLHEAVELRPDNCGVSRHFIRSEALVAAEERMMQNHIRIRLQPELRTALDSETPA